MREKGKTKGRRLMRKWMALVGILALVFPTPEVGAV